MKQSGIIISIGKLGWIMLSILIIAITSALMLLIGIKTLGDAVVALVFLVPISWITTRWGQEAGIAAAVSAGLVFDYFFIPPYYTFNIGSLEGWLILGIFLVVAIVVVGEIQSVLSKARQRENDAVTMFELVTALNLLNTRESITSLLATRLQDRYHAAQVKVVLYSSDPAAEPLVFIAPAGSQRTDKSDRTITLQADQKLLGEICFWKGKQQLPAEDDWILGSFIHQAALTVERVSPFQNKPAPTAPNSSFNTPEQGNA
jgi:K+-sensing histidine kinase KdpD